MESKLRSEIRELQIALQALGSDAGAREDSLRKELMVIKKIPYLPIYEFYLIFYFFILICMIYIKII